MHTRLSSNWLARCIALAISVGAIGAALADDAPAEPKKRRAKPLPAEVDLRPEFRELGLGPRRQGKRNTCSVFTTAGAMEFALSKHQGESSPLSVEYLNWACNRVIRNKTADRGQFFHDLLKGYEKYGICLEREMPYEKAFDAELKPSDEAKESAQKILAMDFTVHWINPWKKEAGLTDDQVQEIKQVLAKGWPVAAGSGHSRLLVGYKDDAEQPGGGKFFTKDSGTGRFSSVTYTFVKDQVGDVFWVSLPPKRGKKLASIRKAPESRSVVDESADAMPDDEE